MLEKYERYIEKSQIEELKSLAKDLKGIKVLHVNSTKAGGGVAEILHRMIPLMNELGIETHWKVIKGDIEFFKVTKKIHNLLHLSRGDRFTYEDVIVYLKYTHENLSYVDTEGYDVVFIHDPQPLGLIIKKRKGQKWIWRCHIDVSTPNEEVWSFLENFVNAYDCAIFHIPEFIREGVKIPSFIIPPSIDPVHDKNRELSEEEIKDVLDKLGIDPSLPIVLQVSRFDRLKDPVGVIKAYKLVKKRYSCQLILAGSFADDDPEGQEVYREVLEARGNDPHIHVFNLPPNSHVAINALQRSATVVVQKSIREGFGLVVSEAMWKGKPVVGGNAGGIRRQIINGMTGYLVNSVEGTAFRIKQLIANRDQRLRMGKMAHERVRQSFLITRHIKDYLMVIHTLLKK